MHLSSKWEDQNLAEMLAKYDTWLRQGRIAYASKVIPVGEALRPVDWILPTDQAVSILTRAQLVALADCTCRQYYKRCSHPLETCLLVDQMAQSFLEAGKAREVAWDEIHSTLRLAGEHGLVHQAAYMPEHTVWAVCSCCSCCCYRLQILRRYGRADLVVHSDYRAAFDAVRCTSCQVCVSRCPFGAWQSRGGRVAHLAERCLGCGLCVSTCPEEAVRLEPRR